MTEEIPQGRIRRTAKLSGTTGWQGARVAAASLSRSDAIEERHIEAARRMVELLGSMKGAAMKLGQIASFLETDFIPEEFRPLYQDALAALRDAAPAMSWPKIEKVLRSEWGEPPARVLAEIETDAAAAASIGQVHRARTHDGRDVAVKVQYPGIAEAVRADLQNIGLITQLAKVLSPGLDARAVAAEIRDGVLEELDYEQEADNQRLFARRYRGHPFIVVPGVLTDLCRERVLVSEWVDGDPFDAVRASPQAERDRFGEILYRFYYGSMNRLAVFNADSHPGNYRLLPDGRVAFLDFGAVKHTKRAITEPMIRLFLAGTRRDAEAVRDILVEIGLLVRPDGVAPERLLENLLLSSGWYIDDREVTMDAERVRRAVAATTSPRGGYVDLIRRGALPAEHVMGARIEAGIAAVLAQLRATRNWHRIAREWWCGDEPSTELGRTEAEFFGGAGRG